MKDITLDGEVADSITLANLIEHYKLLDQQIADHNTLVQKIHPDDYARNLYLLDCMEPVIEYFGGKID